MLEKGSKLFLQSTGLVGTTQSLLGAGSQGEVYEVTINDKSYAAKIYFESFHTDSQIDIIKRLLQIKQPSDSLLWPIDTCTNDDQIFGYVMPIREKRFKPLCGLLKRTYEPPFEVLIQASINLATSFWSLHSLGLCYRDISLSNIFLDPDSGDIQICDNDNVYFDNNEKCGVFGTYRFMAPEIVIGKAFPNTETDLYSLSVLLFYIFFLHHPLEGRLEHNIHCFDLPAMQMIYGSNPVYIFDKKDASNRPIAGRQDNPLCFKEIYPNFFLDVFHDAFTKGLLNPTKRIRETIWKKKLRQLRDSSYLCNYCGVENFVESNQRAIKKCWNCGQNSIIDFFLQFDKYSFPLYQNKKIFFDNLDSLKLLSNKPVAIVTSHPQKKDLLGLKNLSAESWIIFSDNGSSLSVAPGKTVALKNNTKIVIFNKEGKIFNKGV